MLEEAMGLHGTMWLNWIESSFQDFKVIRTIEEIWSLI